MKITRRQLRQIIREAIDVVNASTGEIKIFADEGDPALGDFKPDAPELAARDVIKRLGLTPLENMDSDREPGVEEIYLGAEDWAEMDYEIAGKRHKRKAKKDLARLNIDNLLDRVQAWAMDAGHDYLADNREFAGRLADVAYDLAQAAELEFKPDEWNELLNHFEFNDDDLMTFIAEVIAMQDE